MAKPSRPSPPKAAETLPLLTEAEIDDLFYRFAWPCLRPCQTTHQQASGIGIAKVFWLRLISGTDTEEHIDHDLRQMGVARPEDRSALGSLYFFKMKAALTALEIQHLQYHYSFPVNLVPLRRAEFPRKRPRLH